MDNRLLCPDCASIISTGPLVPGSILVCKECDTSVRVPEAKPVKNPKPVEPKAEKGPAQAVRKGNWRRAVIDCVWLLFLLAVAVAFGVSFFVPPQPENPAATLRTIMYLITFYLCVQGLKALLRVR